MSQENSEPAYEVRSPAGRPIVMSRGQVLPSYCYNLCYDLDHPGSRSILERFVEHGCRVFMLPVRGGVNDEWGKTAFWTGDGEFPDILRDEAAEVSPADMARYVLDLAPDAYLWVRFTGRPPSECRENHPGHMLLNSYGKRYDEPSLASDLYCRQLKLFIRNVVGFCESQPWGERVIGYLSYPIGEGTTHLTCEGHLFDRSPVMQEGFREFLQTRYGSDDALREAWGREDVSLGSVEVPTDQEWHEKGRTDFGRIGDLGGRHSDRIPHRMHWPEPEEMAAEKDYCRYMRQLTERNFRTMLGAVKTEAPAKLAGLDAFKQTMLGWPLMARSRGDYQTHSGAMHPVSGAWGMAELLELGDLDVVATPHDYLYRGMGFGYEGEGIGDSVVLRGKMMFMEEDQRTRSLSEGEKWNYLKDDDEIQAGLWRNLGASVSRGYNTYPMDVCGPSFFADETIQNVLARRSNVHEESARWPHEDVPCAVMVIDDTSVLEEDLTVQYQYLAVIHQRLHGLSRCGVPFRVHLFEDLERDDFPDCHKLFLFPNLFRLTPERKTVLQQRVLCNGNVAVFGPATGITDGTQLTSERVSKLMDIPFEMVRKESPRFVTIDRFDHPVTADLDRRVTYGDSFPYGPLLVPHADEQAMRLGGIQWPSARDGAGLVLKEFGRGATGNGALGPRDEDDYAAVFSCAVPLPADLLRELARYSGTHVYSETDDLVFADGCTLTHHSVHPGARTLQLPEKTNVWDVIARQKVGDRIGSLDIDVDPPQTSMFYLGEECPWS